MSVQSSTYTQRTYNWNTKTIVDMAETGPLFLGLDYSTQQVKVIAIDENLDVVYENHISFDIDLSEFGTTGGVHKHQDGVTITAPTAMWVKALDLTLDMMVQAGFDFSRVKAISGDGQACGCVYWKKGSRDILQTINPDQKMFPQLKDCFSVVEPATWMDSSSTGQCRQLEAALGGPSKLAEIAGSRAWEPYSASHIAKLYQTDKEAYDNTERISMISSCVASLFIGDYAPIDVNDASSTLLLDIHKLDWSQQCLDACAPGLREKLGQPAPSNHVVGRISPYLVSRYEFSPDCKVVVFMSDVGSSAAGLTYKEDDIILSLGTGDGILLSVTDIPCDPGDDGHFLVHPVHPHAYLALCGFKNGSLTREKIMKRCAGSWEKFSELLKSTPMGNNGNIGIYFDDTELQPVISGTFRFDADDNILESPFPDAIEIRAVIEGQFLARRMYAEGSGLQLGPKTRVIATGGASVNKEILQVISDVFNCAVYVTDVSCSAALGGCYRAKQGWQGVPFAEVVENHREPVCAATPTPEAQKVYGPMLERYRRIEQRLVAEKDAKA